MRLSAALVLCCGRDDAEFARRADTIGHERAGLRSAQLGGTPGELVQRINEYAAIGASGTIPR